MRLLPIPKYLHKGMMQQAQPTQPGGHAHPDGGADKDMGPASQTPSDLLEPPILPLVSQDQNVSQWQGCY